MTSPPIFIVGAPRSGTSLLRQMFNRHPRIAICGETHFLELAGRRRTYGDLSEARDRQRFIRSYLARWSAGEQLQMDFERLADRLQREGVSYREMFASILNCYAESSGKPRCGEKTPQHALYAQTVVEWFPNAIILHVVRDPRDVVASLLQQPSASASAVVNAQAWLKLNQSARRCSRHPGYMEVRYEELIAHPEEELRKMCQFIGEEYSSAMLAAEQDRVEDAAGMDRFLTPLTSSRQGVWRQQLTEAEASQIEWALGKHMREFGYAPETPAASMLTVLGGVAYAAFDLARMAIQRCPALWYRYMAPGDLASYERWRYPRDRNVKSGSAVKSIGA